MKRILICSIFILLMSIDLFALELKEKFVISLDNNSAPSDIIFENDGTFLVYDAFSGSILRYNGRKLISKISNPILKHGTCFVKAENTFIFCSNETQSILIINRNLQVLKKISYNQGSKGLDPTDVIKQGDDLFVVDNDNHRLLKFSFSSGRLLHSIGGYGQDNLKFWYPYSMAYDSKTKTIIVSEVLNTRIQRVTQELKFYEILSGWGIKGGQLFRPAGIALTSNGNIIIGDGYNGVIQFLDSNGKFLNSTKKDYGSIIRIRVSGKNVGIIDGWNRKVYIAEIWGER